MRHRIGPLTDERGSVLIASLMLIFVMTLLGVSLFDLAQIEARLALTTLADARAFEAAQAGLERGLRQTLEGILVDSNPATASLADGSPVCSGGCSTAEFRQLTVPFNSMPAGGTYTVSLKLMTVAEANGSPYGQTCLYTPPLTSSTPCDNLALLRSEGVVDGNLVGGPPGYTAGQVVQVLARADSSNPFSGGITTGSPSGSAMNGNVKIHGSIHILGDPGTAALIFGSNDAGMRNNWRGLNSTALDRLTPLQLVCPPDRTCPTTANMVESLGATLKVAKPITVPAVELGPSELGQAGDSASYGSPSRKGKGPLDGIFVADGCVMPCTDNFTGATVNTNVFVDGSNITKPYPGSPPAFPLLEDKVRIGGSTYDHYACVHGSSCFGAAGFGEFFLNHAARLDNVVATGPCSGACPNLGTLFGTDALTDGTNRFTHTFTYTDKTGLVRVGQLCWKRNVGLMLPPDDKTLEFGSPTCNIPAAPSNPLLIYFNSAFKIDRQGGPTAYNYRGAAVIVTTGLVKVEETLQTSGELISSFGGTCPGGGVNCLRKFPEHDMLALLTTSDMEVGKSSANIDHVMGLFYAGCLAPLPCSTTGKFYSQKQTSVVGTVTSWQFCLAGGCGDPGGNVPDFYQVPQDPRTLPEELFLGGTTRWSVSQVPRFWVRCRPGATATSPTTVTGVCSY